MTDLKQRATRGLFWSFVDNSANQVIQFIVGIVLARILSPREFGLVGMLTIFIAISQSFIDSGFGNALIRKKECNQNDYSTIFYFNLLAGLFFSLLLILCSGLISDFFHETQLKSLIIVLSFGLVINSFSLIQRTDLTKRIDFRLQAKISVSSAIISGVVGITMALTGFGVWSLVARMMSGYLVTSALLWIFNRWRPLLVFSRKSFSELFGFGSKLLITGLINTIFQNIYLMVIGKVYSAAELGYFTRADQFKSLPQQNLTKVIERVSYPLLSEIQDDNERLLRSYKSLLKNSMFISIIMVFIISAVSHSLVITLLGEKWAVSARFLQILAFAGIFYPMQTLNRNIMMVKGRSDLVLKIEIIKKVLFIPVIIIGILMSINAMIISIVVYGLVETFFDCLYSGMLINYSFYKQIKDLLPFFIIGMVIGFITLMIGRFLIVAEYLKLIAQLTIAGACIVIICEYFGVQEYFEIKKLIKKKNFISEI